MAEISRLSCIMPVLENKMYIRIVPRYICFNLVECSCLYVFLYWDYCQWNISIWKLTIIYVWIGAGVLGSLVTQPADVIKTRLQLTPGAKTLTVIKDIARGEVKRFFFRLYLTKKRILIKFQLSI